MQRVVILYNLPERLERGERKDFLAEEAILEEIGAVEEAIRSLGHQGYVMAIRDEIFTVIHWLRRSGPMWSSTFVKASMEMPAGR
jgi:hypothetical protein